MGYIEDKVGEYFGVDDNFGNEVVDKINGFIASGEITIEDFTKRPNSIVRKAISELYPPQPVNPDNEVIVIQNQIFTSDGKRYRKSIKTETADTTDSVSADTELLIKKLTDNQIKIMSDLDKKTDIYIQSTPPTITKFSFWLDSESNTLYKGIVDDGDVTWLEV